LKSMLDTLRSDKRVLGLHPNRSQTICDWRGRLSERGISAEIGWVVPDFSRREWERRRAEWAVWRFASCSR